MLDNNIKFGILKTLSRKYNEPKKNNYNNQSVANKYFCVVGGKGNILSQKRISLSHWTLEFLRFIFDSVLTLPW